MRSFLHRYAQPAFLVLFLVLAPPGRAESIRPAQWDGRPLFSDDALDLQSELQTARRAGLRLAVFLELSDCAECRAMKRGVFANPRVGKRVGAVYRTVRVALDASQRLADERGNLVGAVELAEKWRVFAAPAIVFFAPGGELEYRHTGPLSRSDFLRLVQFVVGASYEREPFRSVNQHLK